MSTAPQIRQTLDSWLAPGASLPAPETVQEIRRQWQALKPKLHASYWPIIEDRLSLVDSLMRLRSY
jgi:hypothetical protein